MLSREHHHERRSMQIRFLGHLEASVDDRPVTLGGAKQRAVLAMLGLEANRIVTADHLIAGNPQDVESQVDEQCVRLFREHLAGHLVSVLEVDHLAIPPARGLSP